MTSLQNNWASELNSGTLLFFHLARFPVGQNIAITWTTRTNAGAAPDFRRQVTGWFSEVRHFGFYSLPFKKGTGHYSQVSIKVSPCYHVQSSTHETGFDLDSDGAGGSRSIRCLRTVINVFKLTIRWIEVQLCLVVYELMRIVRDLTEDITMCSWMY
jgi:hypothetical protein